MVTEAVALLLQDGPDRTPDQVQFRLTHSSRAVTGWDGQAEVAYRNLDVCTAVTGTRTGPASEGLPINHLLFTVPHRAQWSAVNWTAVNWAGISWDD